MKGFFQKHSYSMIKMFLNQFATAIFGFVLVLAAGYAKNVALRNITGVCAIVFYLFLLYTMTWDIGFADRVSVMSGKQKRNSWTGVLISLCANIPNYVFAFFIMLGSLLHLEAISSIVAFCTGAALILEGMYTGLLANSIGGVALNSYWFMYFLITLPALITCGIAYLAGLHDKKMTTLFNPLYPESDRDPSPRRRK
jgi:hypothetical protein